MCVCVCDLISVWPFKRFLRGRGGGEDNGSRHYLLLSCRLSVRPHTLSDTDAKWMHLHTCSPTTHTHTRTRHRLTRAWGFNLLAYRAWYAHADTICIEKKKNHTPRCLHTHTHTHTHTEHTRVPSLYINVILRQGWQGFTCSWPDLFSGQRLMENRNTQEYVLLFFYRLVFVVYI